MHAVVEVVPAGEHAAGPADSAVPAAAPPAVYVLVRWFTIVPMAQRQRRALAGMVYRVTDGAWDLRRRDQLVRHIAVTAEDALLAPQRQQVQDRGRANSPAARVAAGSPAHVNLFVFGGAEAADAEDAG